MEDRNGQEYISVIRNTFLAPGMRGNARSPARKQHLSLPGGAASAMHAPEFVHTCSRQMSHQAQSAETSTSFVTIQKSVAVLVKVDEPLFKHILRYLFRRLH